MKIRIETPKALILQRAESGLFYYIYKKIYMYFMQQKLHISFHFVEIVFKKNQSTYAYATIGSKQTSLNLVTLIK